MNVVFKHYRLNEFHCRIEQSGTIKRGEIRANKDDHTSSLLHLRQGNPNFQKTQFIRGKVVCFALGVFSRVSESSLFLYFEMFLMVLRNRLLETSGIHILIFFNLIIPKGKNSSFSPL